MTEGQRKLGELHPASGRCACGDVTFNCLIESETALCACDLCRRSSGSGFQGWVNGSRSSLQVRGVTAAWASTGHAQRHFCVACGSTLFLYERDEPDVVELATGTLDEPSGVVSARESWAYAHQRPSWSRTVGDGPR